MSSSDLQTAVAAARAACEAYFASVEASMEGETEGSRRARLRAATEAVAAALELAERRGLGGLAAGGLSKADEADPQRVAEERGRLLSNALAAAHAFGGR